MARGAATIRPADLFSPGAGPASAGFDMFPFKALSQDIRRANLPIRWQIAAATTFADHGANAGQKALGMGLSLLFDSIKLHESERRLSGTAGRHAFKTETDKTDHRLPFEMNGYSFTGGILIAICWQGSGCSAQERTRWPLWRNQCSI